MLEAEMARGREVGVEVHAAALKAWVSASILNIGNTSLSLHSIQQQWKKGEKKREKKKPGEGRRIVP